MATTAQRYSLANPPPTHTPLTGRETVQEAEVLEVQSLQAEREGNDALSVQLMERAMQIRSHVVSGLGEQLQLAAGTESETAFYTDYAGACNDLYDCAERLVVKCNSFGVESFKRGDYGTATPLLQYALDLTDEAAYPLREDENRRRHLRGVTLNNLGCMQRRQGRFRDALSSLQESMDTTGIESPVAYMNMSAILIQLRLGEEAANMAQRSIDLLAESPEDPSLLAVAHHNLAMALEPIDPIRCLQEYQSAYQIACATVGAGNPTTTSIQRNWQRYQRSHQATTSARGADRQGVADGSHNFVALRAGNTGRSRKGAAPSQTTGRGTVGGGDAGTPFTIEDSTADIFPHPFVSSHPLYRQQQQQQRPPVMASSTPAYKPRVPPRFSRVAAAETVPAAPARIARDVSTSKRFTPSMTAPAVPHPPQQQRQSQQQPYAAIGGAAAWQHRPSTQPPAANSNTNLRLRRTDKERSESERNRPEQPIAQRPSPPPARPSAAQDRLQRFTAARSSQDGAAVASLTNPVSGASAPGRKVADHLSATTAADGPRYYNGKGTGGAAGNRGALTFPGPSSAAGKGKLSPLKDRKPPPVHTRPETNNYVGDAAKKTLMGSSSTGSKKPSSPPRALPPIGTAPSETPKAGGKGKHAGGYDGTHAIAFASAKEVSQFEKKGGELIEYVTDRLEMLLHDEEELERKYRKAVVIQRHYRGHLARRRLGQVRESRHREERLRAIRRNVAARAIQRAFRATMRGRGGAAVTGASYRRPLRGGRAGTEHAAAVKLQSCARGWLARRTFRRQQQYMRERTAAAPRIQRWYRCNLAKRELAARRQAKEAAEAAARALERRSYAATKIQSAWRGRREVQRCQAELDLRRRVRQEADAQRHFAAARTIQCAWRSRQARVEYNRRLSKHLEREAQRKAYQQSRTAAITLQAFARGIITRNRTAPELEKARFRAAEAVNKSCRSHRAAAKIQNAYRGHRARRELAALRAAHNTATSAARAHVLTGLLQRVGRGFIARRALAEEVAKMEKVASRYEYQLAELLRMDAQRAASNGFAAGAEDLVDDEDDHRAELEVHESKARRQLMEMCKESQAAAAQVSSPLPPSSERQAEKGGQPSSLQPPLPPRPDELPMVNAAQTPDSGNTTCPTSSQSETLEGFVKIIKAKQQVAHRKAAVEAYLEAAYAEDTANRREEASALITHFMRGAAATQSVLVRRRAVEHYLTQMESEETAASSITAHEDDRWEEAGEEEEETGSDDGSTASIEDPSRATRPASATGPSSADAGHASTTVGSAMRDDATAARTAAPSLSPPSPAAALPEQGEEDEEQYSSLQSALAAERAKRAAQKAEEDRMRKAYEDLASARLAYKMKQIGSATTAADLAPYARDRIDPARFKRNQAERLANSGAAVGTNDDDKSTLPARPSSRESREAAAAATIYRVYCGYKARQHALHVRALRDEYLALMTDREKVDGPVLTVERVVEVAGAYPPPHYAHQLVTEDDVAALERRAQEREERGKAARQKAEQQAQERERGEEERHTAAQAEQAERERELAAMRAAKEAQWQNAMKPVSGPTATTASPAVVPPPLANLGAAQASRSNDEVLAGFVRMVEAKRDVAERKEEVDAYMRAAEELGRQAFAGEVIARFMRLVAAKAERRKMAMAVQEYLDAIELEDRKEAAGAVIAHFMLYVAARREAAKLSLAVQEYLEAKQAHEESNADMTDDVDGGCSSSSKAAPLRPSPPPASASTTGSDRNQCEQSSLPNEDGESAYGDSAASDAPPSPTDAFAATAPGSRVNSANLGSRRPTTAEEIALEVTALARLVEQEQTYSEVSDETEVLRSLIKSEATMCEAEDTLSGFVKVIAAKKERASRRAKVATHLVDLKVHDDQETASRTITRFMRMAVAKKTLAHRAEAVSRALSALHEEEGAETTSPMPLPSCSSSSAAPPSPSSSMPTVPGLEAEDGPAAPRPRLPTAELVAQERDTLDELKKKEERIRLSLMQPEVVHERQWLNRLAERLVQEEEDQLLEQTQTREREMMESQLLDDLSLEEARLQHEMAAQTGPSSSVSPADVTSQDEVESEGCASDSRDAAFAAEPARAAPATSPAAAVRVLEGFAKVIQAKRLAEQRKAHILQHLVEEEGKGDNPGVTSAARDDDDGSSVETAAAIKIQRFCRRVLARRELELLREEQHQRLETELMAEELLNGVATDIQRVFRGYMGRKQAAARAARLQAFLADLPDEEPSDDENGGEEVASAPLCGDGVKDGVASATASDSASSREDVAHHTAESSPLAPSSLTDDEAPTCGTPLLPSRGLTERDVANAFPERYRELGEPPAARGNSHSGNVRGHSASNSTAIVEEVNSTNAMIEYDDEL